VPAGDRRLRLAVRVPGRLVVEARGVISKR
jgi:hypothetical protein